jgi:hypothetical protein
MAGAALLLAACGAETAVFLVAIANGWSVQEDANRSYFFTSANGTTPVASADITGNEDPGDGTLAAPLSGAYSGRSIHFTVRRVSGGCVPTAEACPADPQTPTDCTCADVTFHGAFTDENHIHVHCDTTGEDYHLVRQ